MLPVFGTIKGAEHVANDLEIEVPAGYLEDCVQINETTPLEPGSGGDRVTPRGP